MRVASLAQMASFDGCPIRSQPRISIPSTRDVLPVDDDSTGELGPGSKPDRTNSRSHAEAEQRVEIEVSPRQNTAEVSDGPPKPRDATNRESVSTSSAGSESSASSLPSSDSPWAPLHVPIFRAFWIASLISNLGTWVHEVGAGWLMTSLDSSPEMVSAVRIAIAGPTMFLAIPAGVIADRVDRRKLLILTQLLLLTTTSLLSTLTFAGVITSWSLLFLTFVIGMGVVMHVLTWQSTIPVLVPKPQISRAIALGSISFNLSLIHI